MSSFEDYTRASWDYDSTREAVALEGILGAVQAADLEIGHSRILDAGCGTGNYIRALSGQAGFVIGVDANPGMLRQARAKLAGEISAGAVALVRTNLTALPLQAASMDAVMVNQVLHHLPDSRASGWHLRRRVLAEIARVLRPGGAFILNACLPAQLRQGWWFYPLIPEALERMCRRHLERDEILELFDEAGFDYQGCSVPLDAVMQGEHYFDTHGPERPEWRNGDSIWADVGGPELDGALAKLQSLHASGEIQGYLQARDRCRLEVGQLSIFHARRRDPVCA